MKIIDNTYLIRKSVTETNVNENVIFSGLDVERLTVTNSSSLVEFVFKEHKVRLVVL